MVIPFILGVFAGQYRQTLTYSPRERTHLYMSAAIKMCFLHCPFFISHDRRREHEEEKPRHVRVPPPGAPASGQSSRAYSAPCSWARVPPQFCVKLYSSSCLSGWTIASHPHVLSSATWPSLTSPFHLSLVPKMLINMQTLDQSASPMQDA